MSEKIVVPVLGESITEATVAKWLKNTGDAVEADEPIVELETDKVNLEVPSPITGTLTNINSNDGSVVEVGALLGTVNVIVPRSVPAYPLSPHELRSIVIPSRKAVPSAYCIMNGWPFVATSNM